MEGNTDRIGCTKRTQRLYSSNDDADNEDDDDDDDDEGLISSDDDDDDDDDVVVVVVVVLECRHSLDQEGGWRQLIALPRSEIGWIALRQLRKWLSGRKRAQNQCIRFSKIVFTGFMLGPSSSI